MSIQNIFSNLCILLFLIHNISFSFDLTPIPIEFYKTYSFSLEEYSKFIIYSFQNDMDPKEELIFRFSKSPDYDSKLFLYYSENDVSQNIDTLIKCNPYTGEFFESFYSTSLRFLYRNNYEAVVNSGNTDIKYILPGYIYAVISIVSTASYPKYKSEIVIYNTKFMRQISILKSYEYIKMIGPYRKPFKFYIPNISKDVNLRLDYYSSVDNRTNINIYENNLNNQIKNIYIYQYGESSLKLSKGNSYYIHIQNRENKKPFIDEILFQFPLDDFTKIEEDKVLYFSSLSSDNHYYFYYDNINMNVGDSLYFKTFESSSSNNLKYKELIYNDYDYISQRRNTYDTKYCEVKDEKIGNISNYFYKCEKKTQSQAFIFVVSFTKSNRIFPNFQIEMFTKKTINNPDNILKHFNKGQIGFYSLKLNELSAFNKNILIYSNENKALSIYCYDFNITHKHYYYPDENYRNYTDIRLFF